METTSRNSGSRITSKVTDKADSAIDRVAGAAHRAVDKAADMVTPAADWLNEQGQELKNAQTKLMKNARGYIAANPLAAVGIAAAAGFVISRLFRFGR